MGLDIYAGTLTRYISGNWKTQLQQYAEANGHGYTKVTPDDEEEGNKNSPEEICKFVSKWRDQVVGVIEKDMQKPKSFFSLFKKKEKISLPVWEENNDRLERLRSTYSGSGGKNLQREDSRDASRRPQLTSAD